jgi:hypothetical protein
MIWTGSPRAAGIVLKTATETEKLERKSFEFEIKDEAKGEIEAVIATFDVVDKDGDVIRKGAIPDGATVAISGYGHSAMFGERPVGKGTISTDGNKAIVKGQLFMEMEDARDTLAVLKGMGKAQQWSWGFVVLGSEMPTDDQRKQGTYRIITKTNPFEASPVIRGAGVGTRTLAAKSEQLQLPETGDTPESTQSETPEQKAEREKREKDELEAKAQAQELERKSLQETMDVEARKFQYTLRKYGIS